MTTTNLDAACRHAHAEPVTLLSGETVAQVCTDCLARLDLQWGCEDCDWVDVMTVESLQPINQILIRDCGAHR